MALKKTAITTPAIMPPSHTLPARPRRNFAVPGLGNVDSSDMTVPRLKLLQGLSPEVQENSRRFFPGEFFHSAIGDMIGKELVVVPLQIGKSHELWAPRDDGQGLLARCIDGYHWDNPHTKFEVRTKSGRKAIWDTKGSLPESGLDRFGTSDPINPKSPPAAGLTYRTALYLPEREDLGGVCLLISSRMAVKGIQDLVMKISARHHGGTPFWGQRYVLSAPEMTKGPNKFYVPSFRADGNITDKELLSRLDGMRQTMAERNVRADDDVPEDETRTNFGDEPAF